MPARKPTTHPTSMTEIARHSSLISCYVSGLTCNALIQTASELHKPEKRVAAGEGDPPADNISSNRQENSDKLKCQILLNSVKISLDAKCPNLQFALCALVLHDKETGRLSPSASLPGLSHTQSQLDFKFTIPTIQVESAEPREKEKPIDEPEMTICNLLELGIRDAKVTCVAKIIHSEVSEDAILTWKNVQEYSLSDPTFRPKSDDYEMKNNKLVIKATLPSLWSQLASPAVGIPDSTGGVDVLILNEAIDAWKPGVEHLIDTAQLALEMKSARGKRVLLTLLTNATRSVLGNKVHKSPISQWTFFHYDVIWGQK